MISHTLSHTLTFTHNLNEGCRTTLIGKMYSKTPLREKNNNKCIDTKRMFQNKSKHKKKTNFFVSGGQSDKSVGLLHCDDCWGHSNRSYCQQDIMDNNYPYKKNNIFFFSETF